MNKKFAVVMPNGEEMVFSDRGRAQEALAENNPNAYLMQKLSLD